MTGITEPSGEKDATFYWPDNVRFLVEGCLFRVPQYPFIAGSEYFAQKYGLYSSDNDTSPPDTVHLEGAAAKEFRIFLRALFPSLSSDSATISFTKREWLCILKLSTLWQFKDLRSLAIKHLEGQLDEIELVQNGRAAYVPRWVATGYRWMVERPAQQVITADEAEVIGNATVNHLWIVRWTRANSSPSTTVVQDIRSTFEHEFATLEARERGFRTKKEIEEEERALEEERAAVEEEERRRAARRAATEALERAEQRRLEKARLSEEIANSTVVSACEQQSQEEHQQVSAVPSIDNEHSPQYPPSMQSTELVESSTTTTLVANGAEVEEVNSPVTDAQKKKKGKKVTCEVCSMKFIREKGQKKTKICGACTAFAQLTIPVTS